MVALCQQSQDTPVKNLAISETTKANWAILMKLYVPWASPDLFIQFWKH